VFPEETMSVEAAFSIETHRRIALAGIVSARLDGVEVEGQRQKFWEQSVL
jgi:hypothetical protein